MNSQLTIQMVTWNSEAALRKTIQRLQHVPEDVIIRIIDNGSGDASTALVRNALPQADIIRRGMNTGFASGHNLGFSVCTTAFVLVLNPDVQLEWSGIKKLLEIFDKGDVGGVQGKLYHTRGDDTDTAAPEVFDTAGIVQTLSLNGVDRGAGEEDRGQFDEPAKVFAVQGACALYRIEALRDIAHTRIDQEVPDIFDEDFFAYKDDVDTGWRMTAAGWKIVYSPVVVGWHERALGRQGVGGWGLHPGRIYQRLKHPRTRLSLRNYCWMLAKNASIGQLILHSPWVLGRLLVFLVFSLLFPPFFSVWAEIARGLPKMLAKRQ